MTLGKLDEGETECCAALWLAWHATGAGPQVYEWTAAAAPTTSSTSAAGFVSLSPRPSSNPSEDRPSSAEHLIHSLKCVVHSAVFTGNIHRCFYSPPDSEEKSTEAECEHKTRDSPVFKCLTWARLVRPTPIEQAISFVWKSCLAESTSTLPTLSLDWQRFIGACNEALPAV